ncbi:MAG TPA: hypothetical protein VIF61_00225 [Methylocystis sp.]|jgi:hypothetical protein
MNNAEDMILGAQVEIEVPGAGDGARFVGRVEGVGETHMAVRLANRMLVSVERALVRPYEMEDAA